MRRRLLLLVPFLVIQAASPSVAQTADGVYCRRLAELVVKYVGKQINGQNRPDSESLVAIDRCEKGDTAAGIPILEKKLLDGRFTLPPR